MQNVKMYPCAFRWNSGWLQRTRIRHGGHRGGQKRISGDPAGIAGSRRILSMPGEQRHRAWPQQAHSANGSW